MLQQKKFINGDKISQMIACMNEKCLHWLTYQVKVVGNPCEYNTLHIYTADSLHSIARPELLNQYMELKFFWF
jgi:hypothetical protein